MAKKNTAMDEDIIDLTDLIETGSKSKAASAYAAAAATPVEEEEDDFEAILAQTAAPKPKESKVDPHETLDMSDMGGIDNLLESLDIPAQPRENGPEQPPNDQELDSVLDDLLGNDKPPKASKPATPEPPDELDDILASFDTEDTSAQPVKEADPVEMPEPAAPDIPDLDADLDDILAEMEPPKPVTPPEPASVAEPEENIGEDIGSGLDLEIPDLDSGLADELDSMGSMPTPSAHLEDATEDVHIPTASVDTPDPGASAGNAEMSPPVEKASQVPSRLSNDSLPAQTWPPDALATICRNLASSQGSQEALQEFSRELGAQSAHVEDMGSQVMHLTKRIMACESKLSAARARIAALEKELEHVSALDDLLREGTALNAGFMSLISSAIANALQGTNLSPVAKPDLTADIEKLDANLWSADQRIEALEKALAEKSADTQIDKLDAGLWSADQRIEALEKAVEELKGGLAQGHLEKLDTDFRGANARILALENQLQSMQGDNNKMMEKTVASIVAKVLHEEISRLAES